jgi:hypothetical protein
MTSFVTAFCLLFSAHSALAEESFDTYGPKPSQAEAARKHFEQNRAKHGKDGDKLVLPGLVADRKAQSVEVLAETTGLKAEEIIEFLLVDQSSGHGYEALVWSYAKPSDIHRALEFVGLKAGSPVNPGAGRFWSDGDPVAVTVRVDDEKPFPMEELILDMKTGKPLPAEGFLFTGSVKLPDGKYAADVHQPRSIASIYNEPGVVLDVPRQVSQSEVYGQLVVNPERVLPGGKLLTVILRPGTAAGMRRGRQVQLDVKRNDGPTGLQFSLLETNRAVIKQSPEVTPALEELVAIKPAPYVTVKFDEALPVGEVSKTCVLLAMLEGMIGAVRVNPPPAGQLYYRAFVPTKDWREPAGRLVQPWELHLGENPELVRYDTEPELKRHAFPVADPAGMVARIGTTPPVLLVYAPANLAYGELLKFVRPVQQTHRTIYVFVEEK